MALFPRYAGDSADRQYAVNPAAWANGGKALVSPPLDLAWRKISQAMKAISLVTHLKKVKVPYAFAMRDL